MKNFQIFFMGLLAFEAFGNQSQKFSQDLNLYLAKTYPGHQLLEVQELEAAVVRVSLLDKVRKRNLRVSLKAVESKSGETIHFELKRSCSHVIEDILQNTKKSI